jgi:hypothetical protein
LSASIKLDWACVLFIQKWRPLVTSVTDAAPGEQVYPYGYRYLKRNDPAKLTVAWPLLKSIEAGDKIIILRPVVRRGTQTTTKADPFPLNQTDLERAGLSRTSVRWSSLSGA